MPASFGRVHRRRPQPLTELMRQAVLGRISTIPDEFYEQLAKINDPEQVGQMLASEINRVLDEVLIECGPDGVR